MYLSAVGRPVRLSRHDRSKLFNSAAATAKNVVKTNATFMSAL
jgi:hypothetical protein